MCALGAAWPKPVHLSPVGRVRAAFSHATFQQNWPKAWALSELTVLVAPPRCVTQPERTRTFATRSSARRALKIWFKSTAEEEARLSAQGRSCWAGPGGRLWVGLCDIGGSSMELAEIFAAGVWANVVGPPRLSIETAFDIKAGPQGASRPRSKTVSKGWRKRWGAQRDRLFLVAGHGVRIARIDHGAPRPNPLHVLHEYRRRHIVRERSRQHPVPATMKEPAQKSAAYRPAGWRWCLRRRSPIAAVKTFKPKISRFPVRQSARDAVRASAAAPT